MDPLLWGPSVWNTLCGLALRDDDRGAEVLLHALDALAQMLPCGHCRNSFNHFLRKHSREACARDPKLYVWTLHDEVNRKLKKPCISYRVFCNRYHCFDFNVEVNALHMMYFIYCNLTFGKDARAVDLSGLRRLFDVLGKSFAARGDTRWAAICLRAEPLGTAEALRTARAVLLKDEHLTERERRAFYESAIVGRAAKQ